MHHTEVLISHSKKNNLKLWNAFGSRFGRIVAIRNGDLDTGLQQLNTELDEVAETDFRVRLLTGLGQLVEALAEAGRITEANALLEAAMKQFEPGCYTPELLRLKGELLLLKNPPAFAEAVEELLRQALELARRQGALSWELRTATSFARLRQSQGRPVEARDLLISVYRQFKEGFDTPDLIAAKKLEAELA
jgi:predicted ATPase